VQLKLEAKRWGWGESVMLGK
jgi:hypothetical protein